MTDKDPLTVKFEPRNKPFDEDDFITRTRKIHDRLQTDEDPNPELLRQTYWTPSERAAFKEIQETPAKDNPIKEIIGEENLFENLVQRIVAEPKDMFKWLNHIIILETFKRGCLITREELQKIGDECAIENKKRHQELEGLIAPLINATPEEIDSVINRGSPSWAERYIKPPSR